MISIGSAGCAVPRISLFGPSCSNKQIKYFEQSNVASCKLVFLNTRYGADTVTNSWLVGKLSIVRCLSHKLVCSMPGKPKGSITSLLQYFERLSTTEPIRTPSQYSSRCHYGRLNRSCFGSQFGSHFLTSNIKMLENQELEPRFLVVMAHPRCCHLLAKANNYFIKSVN